MRKVEHAFCMAFIQGGFIGFFNGLYYNKLANTGGLRW